MKTIVAILAMGLVAAVLFFTLLLAPDSRRIEAELSCGSFRQVFADINACAHDPRYEPGCACTRLLNPWASVYNFGRVPLIAVMAGVLTLRGSVRARLVQLNVGVALAFLGLFVFSVLEDPEALMALPVFPLFAGAYCLGVSIVFYAVIRLYEARTAHAT